MSNSNKQISFQSLDIETCFNNFYLVPDYQREYVWTEKQVSQLLNDLYEEFDANQGKEYFIGSTVVFKNDDGVYELIDGQQRTTTLYLILCAFKSMYIEASESIGAIDTKLRSKTVNSEGNEVDLYRLVLQYRESSNILEYTSNYLGESHPETNSESSARLLEAFDTALEFLRTILNDGGIAKVKVFYAYFLRKLKFIQIESSGISDALKIFETINERGVGLNPMDLLKNLLFRKIKSNEFGDLKVEWEKVIRHLEDKKEKPLRFLRYFLMANYNINNGKSEEVIREEDIYTWLTKPENIKQVGYDSKPFEFVAKLKEHAILFTGCLEGNDKWGRNVYLDNIKKLGGGSFKQHLILLLSARSFDKEMFDDLAENLEVLLFFYFLTGEQAKNFERNFSKWSKNILTIRNKEDLNVFIENYIEPEIKERENIFKDRFMTLNQSSVAYYRLRYILSKIAQYCDLERHGSYSPQTLDTYITKGVEIEHILPYNPEPELREFIGQEYDSIKLMLGNLTILEKSINCSIGNRDFYNVKINEYAKSQYYLTKSISKIENVGLNTSINRLNDSLSEYTK